MQGNIGVFTILNVKKPLEKAVKIYENAQLQNLSGRKHTKFV